LICLNSQLAADGDKHGIGCRVTLHFEIYLALAIRGNMPEAVPASWRGVVNRYNASTPEVQLYYEDIPALIEDDDWEVSLGFMFTRVEKALNTMLYCGARKMHRANSEVARRFVGGFNYEVHHGDRQIFWDMHLIAMKAPRSVFASGVSS
jgi:hypothetical protein